VPVVRLITLVAYSLGMTGNQDRTARAAAWASDLQDMLMPIIDRGVLVVAASAPGAGDVAEVERQARTVGVIARSGKAIVALTPVQGCARDPGQEEDEMRNRDDSPENLERMRTDLEARLDRLNAVLEAKGIVVEPGCWPTARAERKPVHAA
jgi:hypothetical protein